MTITIDLPIEVEAKVATQASRDGVGIGDFLQLLIKEATERRERIETLSHKSFAEILAPVHKGFEESGMSEVEIIEMFEKAREEVWQERQKSR